MPALDSRPAARTLRLMDDADSCAEAALRLVRLDGHDSPDPALVARRLGVALFVAPKSARWAELGERAIVNGEERIYVRSGLSPQVRNLVIGHELGHVIVARWRMTMAKPIEEQWCNRFGASLLAPSRSVRSAWRGDVHAFCARWPHVPSTCMALRIGEARLASVFVTEGRNVRYARATCPPPGDVADLARRALAENRIERPGIRAARLPDVRRRVAIVVDDVA